MCMCLIPINDLPRNGEYNYDCFMEGLTMTEVKNTICKMTSTQQEKEITGSQYDSLIIIGSLILHTIFRLLKVL